MKRDSIKQWVGAGLLASTFMSACNNVGSQSTRQGFNRPPAAMAKGPVRQNQGFIAPAPMIAQVPAGMTTQGAPSPDSTAPAEQAVVQANSETASAPATAPVVNSGMIGTSGDPVAPETTPRRRSYVDVTAHPSFRHADDYSSLCGQVQISRLSKGVRLRYASVDETDAYGGSVTLVEDGRLADFKDGQFVRVAGHLLNPGDKAIAPLYQIDSIQPLEKQE